MASWAGLSRNRGHSLARTASPVRHSSLPAHPYDERRLRRPDRYAVPSNIWRTVPIATNIFLGHRLSSTVEKSYLR